METDRTSRPSRIEIVGAWFHLWTPRRGVEVPPAPWRWIAAGAVLALAGIVALVVVLSNDASSAERRAATREERAQLAIALRERAHLKIEQAVHRGRGERLPPSRAAQAALVGDLEHAITADAQARFKAHSLDTRPRTTQCQPFVRPSVPNPPPPPLTAAEGKYECIAVTSSVPATGRTEPASVGYPFWGRIDFRTGSFLWCRINPRPAEHGTYDELAFVPLPRECDFTRGS